MEKIKKKHCKACDRETTWIMKKNLDGLEKWVCETCGYGHIKEKDASDEKQFAFSSFWASVDTLLSDSQGDISWDNQATVLQIEEDINECKDMYKDDALFNILLAAHLTQGFKKYPKDRIYVKTLYKHAKANAKKHQESDTVNKLVELYEEYAKGLRMRAVKKAVGVFAAAAVTVAACFVALILYTPRVQDPVEDISVSIPNDAISVFDKLFAKVSVEKASSGSSAYVDAKEALRNESEKFELYDISLTSHNKELELDGSVTVTLPIPDGYDESALTVYYVASADSYEEIPKSDISISNGEISFKTTHFSYYAIAERHPIVTFDTNGADEIPHQTVKRDTTATKPADPIKEGYTFAGWKKDGKTWDFSADNVRSDMTLTAEWVANKYNVTLIANGVELENTVVSVTYSEAYAELPTELSKPGFAFVGWYTKESGGSLVTRESVMLTASDVTLYARFSENTNKLEFDPNGGEGEMLAIELSTGATQRLPGASFSKVGHTFVGWSTTLSGEVEYIDKAEYTMGTNSSYTLYAVWQVDTNILKFDGNGADSGEMSAEEHLWGSVFNLTLNSFGKAGYSFNGWALRPDGEAVFHNGDEYTMGERETYTLYACWKPNVNTVKFNSAGGSGSMKNQSITYGEGAYLDKNEFTLEGYDFLGWSDTQNGSVKYPDGGWYYVGTDSEYTLYAVWGAKENQIFFMPNGGTGTMENILKIPTDGEGELPQNPFIRTGYTFFAWCTTSDGTGECYDEGELYNMTTVGDVTLYAIWKPVLHTVSYVTNSPSELPCDEYTIESGLEMPKATSLQKEYYTFAGWYANADFDGEAITVIESGTLGADTYYAKWTPVLFPITYVTNGGTVIEKDYYTVEDNHPLKDKDDTSKTGYDFAGWYETSELTGEAVTSIEKGSTGAKVYYAKWEIITYYIYFDTGFETKLESITYNIESETFELPEFEDERLGYTFRGWYNNPSNHGTAISYIAKGSHGSMTLYADWSTNEYDIIYVTNGGEYMTPEKYTVLDKIRLTTPVKGGYAFLGWYTAEDFGGDAITAIEKGSVGDVTLYAAWKPIEYTLTLHSTSGDITKTFTVETPSFNITDKDIKNCYDFNYWQYIDETPCYTIPQGTCENIQLYPNHTPTDYIISFDTHGGNAIHDKHYNVETESFTLPIPVRSGYTFLGWYIDVSYSGLAVSSISKGTNGSFTLHAKWDINEYIVNTETNGGNDLGSLTYTVESGILSLPKAERSGYDFIGWHLRSDLSDEIITQIPTGTTGNMTLYAEWSAPIEYIIIFITNGGTHVSEIKYTVESGNLLLPETTKDGYYFVGWHLNADFSDEIIVQIPAGSVGNMTLYAEWSNPIEYTINFVTNGGSSVSTITYTVESGNLALPATMKSGYDFLGWCLNSDFSDDPIYSLPAGSFGNKVLYAYWSDPIVYKIAFVTDGGTLIENKEYIYGNPTSAPQNPTKSGYNFDEWQFDDPDFKFGNLMPDHNIVATAVWSYKTVYYDSGYSEKKIDASHEYDYDTFDISELSVFMKEGYKLSFSVAVYMWEENEGYQEIYLRNSCDTNIAGIGDDFAHGGGGVDGAFWEYFEFTVDGEKCTDIMYLRYGAHGKYSDDWYRARATITVKVIKE